MGEFLKQVPKMGDDKVEITGEGLDALALEVDKETFNKLIKNLSETLTKKIYDEGISDETVKQIVENSNIDITEILIDFGNGATGKFDNFNNQFSELFAGANLDQYINEVSGQTNTANKSNPISDYTKGFRSEDVAYMDNIK